MSYHNVNESAIIIVYVETGRCFCRTKGITGEDCKRCDTQNNYSGDPTNSSCFCA